jgi:phosphotransferase system HPr-like phosphotransfer protein
MGLLMLGAAKGSTIRVAAEGPEATPAIAALETLIAEGFRDDGPS